MTCPLDIVFSNSIIHGNGAAVVAIRVEGCYACLEGEVTAAISFSCEARPNAACARSGLRKT